MAVSSGTFGFQPAFSDLIIAAYARCMIRRTGLTVDHLQDAAMAANLLQVEWSNEQVNLWTVEEVSTPLLGGHHTYDVDPTTVMIMAAWISSGELAITVDDTNIGIDTIRPPTCDAVSWPEQTDRIITSVDRDTYASFPNKLSKGPPTVYWFNRQRNCSITLWQVPDLSQRYTLHYFRAHQMQDASMADGLLADVPYRFLEAYVAALAFKLAEMYSPSLLQTLAARAKMTFDAAAKRDIEDSPLRIVPAIHGYTSAVY